MDGIAKNITELTELNACMMVLEIAQCATRDIMQRTDISNQQKGQMAYPLAALVDAAKAAVVARTDAPEAGKERPQ